MRAHTTRSTILYPSYTRATARGSKLSNLLTVSVYEGVVVVVSADVSLQRSVREGGRRPVPVAHNSHLNTDSILDTTTLDGETRRSRARTLDHDRPPARGSRGE